MRVICKGNKTCEHKKECKHSKPHTLITSDSSGDCYLEHYHGCDCSNEHLINCRKEKIQQMEYEFEKLTEKIEAYIKECRYTWTVKSIIEQYQKRVRGEYISRTAKDVVLKFENELHKFYNYGLYEQPQQQSTDTAFAIHSVVEQLPQQICYKTNEPCKHNCQGLCKESC